jgi:hypothetical protein
MSPFGPSLLVSIPGSVLDGLELPGSIFEWQHLRDAVLTPELRVALNLVVEEAAARRTTLRFIARPEIFTHGASRAWLDARLGDATDHLALTDGHTLRTIPGLRNHVFFYARGLAKPEAALHRLLGVAPELLAGLASQVNGTLAVRLDGRSIRPPTITLRFVSAPAEEAGLRMPFALPVRDPERAGKACAEASVEAADAPPAERPLHYIPLSEAALADAAFVAWLARLVQRCALANGPESLLLGLPAVEGEDATAAQSITAVLRALAESGATLPRAKSWSVRFATAAPGVAELAGGRITLHPAVAFWRFAPALFEAAQQVQVAGGYPLAPFQALFSFWLGREVASFRLRLSATGCAA